MKRRQVLLAALVASFACSEGAVAAEQRRIGLLSSGSSDTSLSDAFYDGLRESGFIVGQNIPSSTAGQTGNTTGLPPSPPNFRASPWT
jgi:hypothetical protein